MTPLSPQTREVLLSTVLDVAADAIVAVDTDQTILFFNKAAERTFGYTAAEVLGRPLTVLLPTDSGDRHVQNLRKLVEVDVPFRPMTDGPWAAGRRKDGTKFPADVHIAKVIEQGRAIFVAVLRDLSQMERAEEALRESEVRYRALFENSIDAVFLTSPDGPILAANPAACRMLGRTEEEICRIGRAGVVDMSDPRAAAAMAERERTGKFRRELTLVRKDGTRFEAEVSSAVFTDRNGHLRTSMVCRDITDRKQAEAALRQREEEYRGVFETVNDGLIISTLDGHIVEINPAACRMYGLTRDEFLSLDLTGAIHPEYLHTVVEFGGTAPPGWVFEQETTDTRKDGTCFNTEVRARQFLYKGEPHMLAVIRDITERKRAEDALREQEALLRKVLEILPVGVWVLDREGRLVLGNQAGQDIWAGTRFEDVTKLGQDKGWRVDTGKPIAADEWAAARAIRNGETSLHEIIEIERFDGSRGIIDNSAVPIFDDQGRITSGVIVNQDVTDRIQAYRVLEQRVAERTRELSALLEVSRNVASMLDLKTVLNIVLDQLGTVLDFTGAGILVLEGDHLRLIEYRGAAPREKIMEQLITLERDSGSRQVILSRAPVIFDDIWEDANGMIALRAQWEDEILGFLAGARSWMGVPLIANHSLIGVLRIEHTEPERFTAEHARLAMAFAEQAAIAIENIRLRERAQQAAALEERQRLARELHDSVSQALYGIVLGARTANVQLKRSPAEAEDPLKYVLSLAETAFAEMRALIFELRPDSLETEGLAAALTRQVDVLKARHNLDVRTEFDAEPSLPVSHKETLYRIMQEALNNVAKHAKAHHVILRLTQVPNQAILEVIDDGAGFNLDEPFPGHMGLRSMRERAEQMGGTFRIESKIGQGTRLEIRVPVDGLPADAER